jgi:hypothetical protein
MHHETQPSSSRTKHARTGHARIDSVSYHDGSRPPGTMDHLPVTTRVTAFQDGPCKDCQAQVPHVARYFKPATSPANDPQPCVSTCREVPYVGYLVTAAALMVICLALYALLTLQPPDDSIVATVPLQPLLLAVAAAIPATQTLIMSKAFSMMVIKSLAHDSQLGSWFFWLAGVLPVLSTGAWVFAMSHGLAHFPSIVIVPVLQVRRRAGHISSVCTKLSCRSSFFWYGLGPVGMHGYKPGVGQ